ncbi:hypothetical protein BV898_01766 [Hypsibius exemplaris]|uniref:Uncharacterized protein n=1 Tax=Hypsibius exemplaris TaxID=2072580 RepID=A0A1W0XA80_HYPEX|nr:hypothetical protein BV898_01766 [Hypsibius exemplaris]
MKKVLENTSWPCGFPMQLVSTAAWPSRITDIFILFLALDRSYKHTARWTWRRVLSCCHAPITVRPEGVQVYLTDLRVAGAYFASIFAGFLEIFLSARIPHVVFLILGNTYFFARNFFESFFADIKTAKPSVDFKLWIQCGWFLCW